MNEKGSFYLHTNGTLIYKPYNVYARDPSYFNSPMVRKTWRIMDSMSKEDFKSFLLDAMSKGALPLEVKRVGTENGLSEKEIEEIWDVGVRSVAL